MDRQSIEMRPVTIHPAIGVAVASPFLLLSLVTLAAGLAVAHSGPQRAAVVVGGVVMVVLFVVAVVGLFGYHRNVRMVLGAGHILHTDALGRVRRIPRVAVLRVAYQTVSYGRDRREEVVWLFGQSDSPLLVLQRRQWREEDLDELWKYVGRTPEPVVDGSVAATALRRMHPELVPYWKAHPNITALIVTAVLIGGGVALLVAVKGH